MERIEPEAFYEDYPCSIVAIACAMNKNPVNELKDLYEEAKANDNYASLQRVNKEIRKLFNVKKYLYFTRNERVSLEDFHGQGKAIVCVYGHYIYCDFSENKYYSFFDNLNDKVVAVWELL